MTTTMAELRGGDAGAADGGPAGGGMEAVAGFVTPIAVADVFFVGASSGTMTVASALTARAAAASEDVVDAAAFIASANSCAFW